jgi:hypothetical protein
MEVRELLVEVRVPRRRPANHQGFGTYGPRRHTGQWASRAIMATGRRTGQLHPDARARS